MENHWETCGKPMEHLWKTSGNLYRTNETLMEDHRKTFGTSMLSRWKTDGKPMDNLWKPKQNLYGTSMENRRKPYGKPMENKK